jgi:hypothetical protein
LSESSLDSIDKWLERALNRSNGLMYTMRFTEKLLAKLEWYQQMMEGEAREERARHAALNFKTLEEQVREAGTAFLRRETRVQTACENYKGLVNRECELYVQAARRDKATELYGSLRAHVEELRQRCDRIRMNLEASLKKFEQSFLDVTASRGGENPFEHILQFDAEAHRPELEGEEFVKWHNEKYGSLSMWAGMRGEDVAHNILAFVKERYHPLTGLPIDDVLRRTPSEHVVRELNQLSHLAVPLWHYNDAKIPIDNRDVISELFHYGVADAEQTVLQDPKLSGRIPREGSTDPSFVSTQDAQRIVLFKVKVGVPLFAMHGMEDLERAYHDPDKVVSNHVHREWENFPGIIPRAGEGEALRWFAIAQCPPPIGLISRRGDWYYIRSRQAKRTDKGELRLDQGRLKAYEAFEKNGELVKEVKENIDTLTRAEGEAKINGLLRQHVENLTAQMSGGNVDPSIKEQVERELEEIDKHLREMATIR